MKDTTKTVIAVTAGAAAGIAIANYMTDGAVVEAFSSLIGKKEVIGEAVEDIADIVSDTADEVIA